MNYRYQKTSYDRKSEYCEECLDHFDNLLRAYNHFYAEIDSFQEANETSMDFLFLDEPTTNVEVKDENDGVDMAVTDAIMED